MNVDSGCPWFTVLVAIKDNQLLKKAIGDSMVHLITGNENGWKLKFCDHMPLKQ